MVLSGGGAYGAYGAGFLNGWTDSGERPQFDVVTGVSTGSIIASLAFLGSEYDALLKMVYTEVRQEDVLEVRFLLTALFSESFFKSDPLAELLDQYLTNDIINKVAAEHRKGRRLYVGTTNLDTRKFVVWDMGAIANRPDDARYAYFRKVIRASASIPIALEPVYFEVEADGRTYSQMHVDGGAVAPIFLESWMLRDKNFGEKSGDVYVILNMPMGEDRYEPVTPDLAGIGLAALRTYSDSLNEFSRKLAQELAQSRNYAFHAAAVPPELGETFNPLEIDQAQLKRLFDSGYEAGQSQERWRHAQFESSVLIED